MHHCFIRVIQVTEIGQSSRYRIVQRLGRRKENDVPFLVLTHPIIGMRVWVGFSTLEHANSNFLIPLYLVTIRLVVLVSLLL